ncbi:MAG: carbohydrate ABC transporter permease [Fimbriimonadaceae bacterium]|nr:carbohydrate ABC transporter permease [Fimbriimonadaceae bacterium]
MRKYASLNYVMVAIGLLFVAPFAFMFFASFKREAEVLRPEAILPKAWDASNYEAISRNSVEAPINIWFLNSVFIATATTLLVITLASLTAFAITRLKVRGGNIILGLIVGTMMIPAQLFLIPLYVILRRLHLLDTPYAMILPSAAGGFGVFMLSSFMRSLPTAIEEAALLDGCTLPQMFWKITLPLCGPSIATLAVFTFIASWNDYITPLTFMESVTNYTLPVGIALFQSSYSTQYGLTIATSLIATAPLVIAFLVFQKQIIESMTASGLKE